MAILHSSLLFWFVQTVLECKEFSGSMCFTVQLSRFSVLPFIEAAWLFYLTARSLSRTFLTFFEVFYQLLVLFVTPSRQLNYNTTSIPGCQLLFLFFSNFLKYYILLLIYRNQEEFITPALETKITYGSVLHCRHISKKTLLPSRSYYA